MRIRTAAISKKYLAGTHTFPADHQRMYLMIIAGAGSTTVAFGETGDAIPVTSYIEPLQVPTTPFVVVTTGDCYILATSETHAGVVTT